MENEIKIFKNINYKELIFEGKINEGEKKSLCYEKINFRFKTLQEYIEYYLLNPLQMIPILFLILSCSIILIISFKIIIVSFNKIKLLIKILLRKLKTD